MNKHKSAVESIVLSVMFITFGIIFVLVLQKGFTNDFNQITGNLVASVNISPPIPSSCNMTIYPGWNLVSFFCITTLEDIQKLTSNLTNSSTYFTYRASDSIDPWKAYNTDLPSWVSQDLDYFSRREAYWIYFNISNNVQLFINGSKRIPTDITLYQGFNLVGYPSDIEKAIEEAIISVNESYSILYTYNNSGGFYLNYSNGTGELVNISPYKGYWFKMNKSDTWRIEW